MIQKKKKKTHWTFQSYKGEDDRVSEPGHWCVTKADKISKVHHENYMVTVMLGMPNTWSSTNG
jgi:hypothetical protein